MKRLSIFFVLIGLLFTTSCGLQKEGLVLMTDQSYKASVFATNKMGFGSPDGLIWHKGKLYIADEGGSALEVWSKADGLKTLMDSSFGISSPEKLVVDSEGNAFFTDDDVGGLWEVDAAGNRRLVAGRDKGLIYTKGITLAPDGSILVGDGEQHEVFRVTRDGTVSEFLGKEYGITRPEGLVYDDKGNLYIADEEDNILYMLDPNRNLHRLIDQRDSFSPEALWYVNGLLYIADEHFGKVYVYTPNDGLKPIATFAGSFKQLQGITVDDQGDLYVAVQTDLKHKVGHIIKLSKENTDVAAR
jgi:DNA-binding beta-propeller fold protein YncE